MKNQLKPLTLNQAEILKSALDTELIHLKQTRDIDHFHNDSIAVFYLLGQVEQIILNLKE